MDHRPWTIDRGRVEALYPDPPQSPHRRLSVNNVNNFPAAMGGCPKDRGVANFLQTRHGNMRTIPKCQKEKL